LQRREGMPRRHLLTALAGMAVGMGPGWSKDLRYGAKDGAWERASAILETSLMLGIAFQ